MVRIIKKNSFSIRAQTLAIARLPNIKHIWPERWSIKGVFLNDNKTNII